ncbi:hypothetical protein H4R26_002061, partial [Coemansia thaxteri]
TISILPAFDPSSFFRESINVTSLPLAVQNADLDDSETFFEYIMIFEDINQNVVRDRFVAINSVEQLTNGSLGTNSKNLCKICQKDPEGCFGHPGFITAHEDIISPCHIDTVIEDLVKTCWECDNDLGFVFEDLPKDRFMKAVKSYVRSYGSSCPFCTSNIRVDTKWISERNCFISKNEKGNCIDELTLERIPQKLEKYIMKFIPIFPVYNNDLDDPKNKRILRNISSLLDPKVNTYEVYAFLIGLERNSKYQSVRKMISSKNGLMEQNILGKRVNFFVFD